MISNFIEVLVVVDNMDLTEILKYSLLEYANIRIVGIANSGYQALQMMQKSKIDIVLLDIIMTDMDGMEVLSYLNSMDGVKPSVIVFSALGSDAILQRVIELGADGTLLKPVEIQTIIKKFDQYMKPNQTKSQLKLISDNSTCIRVLSSVPTCSTLGLTFL